MQIEVGKTYRDTYGYDCEVIAILERGDCIVFTMYVIGKYCAADRRLFESRVEREVKKGSDLPPKQKGGELKEMKTVKEIADKLGITTQAVRSRIRLRGIEPADWDKIRRAALYSDNQVRDIAEDLPVGRKS